MIDLLSTVMNTKSKRRKGKDSLSCIHCRFYTDYDNGHWQGECALAPYPDDTYGYNSACSKVEERV